MSAFSLSKAALAKHCRYPFRPDVVVPADTSESEERDTGNDCHAAAAALINGRLRVEPVMDATNRTWAHMAKWIRENYQASWVAEVALAWDPEADTARVLGVDIGREYEAHGLTGDEVPGTCDLVSVEGDIVCVYEFGTGFDIGHKMEQLRLQCVAAARAYGKDRVIGQLLQFRDDGVHPWAPIHLDGFDLSVIAGEFAELRAGIPTAEPAVSDACVDLFCDARTVCPVTHEAQAALVPEGALARKFSKDITDPEQARWMLERVRLVKAACEEIKDAINAYVPAGGIELSDGKYIYEGAREMARFDSHKALALIKQLGATDAQIASLTRPVIEGAGLKVGTKKAAESAAAKRAKR